MLRKAVVTVGVVVGVLGFCCMSYGADLDKGLSFYLPFDNSLKAKVSTGVEAPKKTPIVKYEKGVKGEGVVINGTDRLDYKVKKGYLSFERGTISLWIKANFDDISFREKIGIELKRLDSLEEKDGKKRTRYYLSYTPLSISSKDRVGLWISHSQPYDFAVSVLLPGSHHYKSAHPFELEKDKWINLLYAWDVEEESIEFYVNGKRIETKINGSDFWNMPDKINYDACTIRINGTQIHGGAYTILSHNDRRKLLKEFIPENYTYTIDELRIYNRALSEEDVKELFLLFY